MKISKAPVTKGLHVYAYYILYVLLYSSNLERIGGCSGSNVLVM